MPEPSLAIRIAFGLYKTVVSPILHALQPVRGPLSFLVTFLGIGAYLRKPTIANEEPTRTGTSRF